jgi:hypothetical protein
VREIRKRVEFGGLQDGHTRPPVTSLLSKRQNFSRARPVIELLPRMPTTEAFGVFLPRYAQGKSACDPMRTMFVR